MSIAQSMAEINVAATGADRNSMRQWEVDARARRRFRVDPSKAGPKRVFLNCHGCGYAPPNARPTRGGCPKCGSRSWDRFALPLPLVPQHML